MSEGIGGIDGLRLRVHLSCPPLIECFGALDDDGQFHPCSGCPHGILFLHTWMGEMDFGKKSGITRDTTGGRRERSVRSAKIAPDWINPEFYCIFSREVLLTSVLEMARPESTCTELVKCTTS